CVAPRAGNGFRPGCRGATGPQLTRNTHPRPCRFAVTRIGLRHWYRRPLRVELACRAICPRLIRLELRTCAVVERIAHEVRRPDYVWPIRDPQRPRLTNRDTACVFHVMPVTDSTASRSAIPYDPGH